MAVKRMNPMVGERLTLSRKEVALLLGCSVNFLLQREQAGDFPAARRLGRRVLYDKEAVLDWVHGGAKVVAGARAKGVTRC